MNFDNLADKKGSADLSNFENGQYHVKIEAADMKPKAGKPDYMNVRFGIISDNGARIGSVFDIIAESDHALPQYKARKFIEACQLDLHGEFSLKDLAKLVVNKEMLVYLKVQTDEYGSRIVVDVAPDDIYLPYSGQQATAANLTAAAQTPAPADGQGGEAPFTPDINTADENY